MNDPQPNLDAQKPRPRSKKRLRITVARRKSRRCAVQAIYQWQLTDEHPKIIAEQFTERDGYDGCDEEFFARLLDGVTRHFERLDGTLRAHLDREVEEPDQVERAILRIACFELCDCLDIPWRASVNEAVEMAKLFGAEESFKYVNGVLDSLAQAVRSAKVDPRPAGVDSQPEEPTPDAGSHESK